MDRGAWWATVHGVTKSWTWLSNWTTTNNNNLPLIYFVEYGSLFSPIPTPVHHALLLWRSTSQQEAVFSPGDMWQWLEAFLVVTTWRREERYRPALSASSGERPGMLPSILQHVRWSPSPKKVSSLKYQWKSKLWNLPGDGKTKLSPKTEISCS